MWWLCNSVSYLLLLVGALVAIPATLLANFELTTLKNVVIFPPKGVHGEIANEIWWQIRELLANDGRFLIATRRLMINRQTLTPKGEISPAEVVVLGKILEANLIITLFVKDHQCYLHAYRSYDGITVFADHLAMSYSLTEEEQLLTVFKALTERFLQAIPYSGYQVMNPISQQYIDFNGSKPMVYVEFDQNTQKKSPIGQDVYWLNMRYPALPLFQQSKPEVRILGIGKIREQLHTRLFRIELTRYSDLKTFEKENLIYLPQEEGAEGPIFYRESQLSHEFLLDTSPTEEKIVQQGTEATFLGFLFTLGSLVLMIF